MSRVCFLLSAFCFLLSAFCYLLSTVCYIMMSAITECMEGYKAAFGEKAEASMLDIASVTADVVGRSGLGRDLDAEDLDSDVTVDADDEIVGNEGSKESGSSASYAEVEAEDSDVLDDDDFARSSKESDAAAEVAAARANRSMRTILVVPSAKLQFWRHEQRLLRQGKTV
jgi:hypothetical protein